MQLLLEAIVQFVDEVAQCKGVLESLAAGRGWHRGWLEVSWGAGKWMWLMSIPTGNGTGRAGGPLSRQQCGCIPQVVHVRPRGGGMG